MNEARKEIQNMIRGRAEITGPPLSRMSMCLICAQDTGPWLTRQAAEVAAWAHLMSSHLAGRV